MNTPSLIEVLIVALAFGIVGTYVLACRHFLNSSLNEPPTPRQATRSQLGTSSPGARHAHA